MERVPTPTEEIALKNAEEQTDVESVVSEDSVVPDDSVVAIDTGVRNTVSFNSSPEEEELIQRLRSDDKNPEKYRGEREVQRKVDEAPSADEEAYASVFAPVSTLNEVHAHCSYEDSSSPSKEVARSS